MQSYRNFGCSRRAMRTALCLAALLVARFSFADTSMAAGWTVVSSPNATATNSNELAAVTCASSQDCWAVGHYLDENNRQQTLIEHWDGTSWSIVPSPNAGSVSALTGVACASGSECWAVGFQSTGGALQTLIQRWNGTSWSVVPSPNKTTQDNRLDGVTCDPEGRCWAVGSYSYPTETLNVVFKPSALGTLIERWNGTSWEIVASPNYEVDPNRCFPFKCTPLDNTLAAVTCTSASDCWAVGTAGIGQLIVRWNGTSWRIVLTAADFDQVNFGELRVVPKSITCTSGSDCRVVGAYYGDYNNDTDPRAFILRWNGTKWALSNSPNPRTPNALTGVTCPSSSDCWAAGFSKDGSTIQTLIERWDGNAWSIFPSGNAGGTARTNSLAAVTCTSGAECWAVGSSVEAGRAQTLIQRYRNAPSALAPAQLQNISTRLRVQTGDNVMIAGFIVTGSAPKRVILRAIGPSLSAGGSPAAGRMLDPTLELNDNRGARVAFNDNWKDSPERAEIESSGIPPGDDREAAIARTLLPGTYTATLRGAGESTGIALVEVYDVDAPADSRLANISTRGFVETDDNVMIGGFIIGPNDRGTTATVVRAIGPSLTGKGVSGALQDPSLFLYDQDGTLLTENDNWKDSQRAEIEATGIAPTAEAESAILRTLGVGNYTAIVRGKGGTTGVALVEVYNLGQR